MAAFNPFNPNSVVTPTLFAGRSRQVLQILQKLAQVRRGMAASFILQGDRGIGKTALAKLIMHVASSKNPTLENLNFLTSYYSVEKGQHFATVLQASLNLLTDRMPSSVITRLTERLGGLFKNGKFTIGAFGATVTVQQQQEFPLSGHQEQYLKDQAVSALSNILEGLKE